jgi:hypothetical protein
MEDSLICGGRGVSTTPYWTAATVVAPAAAEAVETVVVAAGGLFIDPDPGTAIDSDRATVSDWVAVLDPVWGIGICSARVAVTGSKSSDLAVLMDSDGVAARRFVVMDSEVVVTNPSRDYSAQVLID